VLVDIDRDPDLFLETVRTTDWALTPISSAPLDHAFARQLNKQRDDISYAFANAQARNLDLQQRTALVNHAAQMPGLLGPQATLALREAQHRERKELRGLPDWFKYASPEDARDYLQRLQDYDQSRAALLSVLGGAASSEQFSSVRLRARIANDLGYDIDPEHLNVSTWRNLPLTNEPYKVSRPLNQLALYGLHPGDMTEGSVFLTWSTLNLQGQPLGLAYPGLTNRYLGELIEELDLRSAFAPTQREAYGSPTTQILMKEVTRQQVKVMAFAAKLQGHLQPQDFDLIESLDAPSPETAVSVQQVTLNTRDTLSNVLVFRKEDAQGRLDRLILFTPDIPRDQRFQAFDEEQKLLQELVSWSARPDLSDFLLSHVPHASRAALQKQLYDLSQKPQPPANFLSLVTQQNYEEGLDALVTEQVRVTLSEQAQHSPDWYLRASPQQRQQLIALEDAINAASHEYRNKPHAQVQAFEDYVHERATQAINTLLGTAPGTVDPDTIIITSAREKLSYTQMLRNGYDDSINPISTSPLSEARFSGPEGVDLTPLTAEKVARSVHGKWLSDDYVSRIKNTLLNANNTGYTYRRRASLLITQLQMSAAALRSQLKGEITESQYQWLKASIERMHLSDEATRRRYPLYPLQFKLHNSLIATDVPALGEVLSVLTGLVVDSTQTEAVLGCYVLTPDSSSTPDQALIYTPNAPDGPAFRPLNTFVDTLKHDAMSDYYKDRCRLKEDRKLAFFLTDMKQGGNSQPPSLPATPFADLYHTEFNWHLERKIRDVEDTTIGRNDMLEKLVWTSVELIATALTLPFPPASFAVGALLAFRDSAHALRALSEGDREAASGYILSSLFNSVGAVGDLHSGIKGFGGVLRQVTRNGGQNPLLQTAKQLQHLAPPLKDLRPIQLQGEVFWAGKPHSTSRVPLYQTSTLNPQTPLATGHFADKDLAGVWQPLRRETNPSAPAAQGAVNRAYAVDVSLTEITPIASGHAQGVTLIQGQHYIEVDGLTFRVQFDSKLSRWNIIDPENPFAFFGKQPVRLGDQGQWQVVDGLNLRGGVRPRFQALNEQAAGPSTAVSDISDYELPPNMQEYMHGIVDPALVDEFPVTGLDFDELRKDLYAAMRGDYLVLRQNLYRDATAFFERVTLPARPTLPRVDVATTPEKLIEDIYANTNGLMIGEAPASIASKQFLIDNMPLLAEQKVEVLYIEHLFSDHHRPKLDKYWKRGSKTKSGSHAIKDHFDQFNAKALRNGSEQYDYYHLVKAAHQHNIEVKPLSSSVSYPVIASPVQAAAGDSAAAQKMSNFFAHKLLDADIAAKPERRWIALLNQQLMNTYQGLPGLTEMHGAISIRIKDVPAGRLPRVVPDAGESIVGKPTVKGDFRLEMANPLLAELTGPLPTPVRNAIDQLDAALYSFMEGKPYVHGTPNPYAGDYGFKLDDAGQWQRAAPSEWRADDSLTPIQQSLIDADYDMPVNLRADLHELANFQHKGLDELYHLPDDPLAETRRAFFSRRQQLQSDARRVISGDLPPRPNLPDVPSETTVSGFLDSLYEHASGVVIGEAHSSVASKKLIIDNLPQLAKQEVKTLYLEHLLTDLHQVDLDRFADTGQMSKSLLHELRKMDQGHLTDPNKVYTFERLVIKAREHGLEVRAIDCAASYHLKGMHSAPPTNRQQMMNFFASRTISKHQAVMGSHKWIALVGNSHANTFQKIVPGVAELEQGIGVRVLDVGPGQASIGRDPGENVVERFGGDRAFLQSDYRLEMETLESPVNRDMPTESEAGL
ncbi:MAG: type effector HopAC1, partial [Pseudomonas sp.]|nr:type effector HopAC1 [Pseudomonas sp.]